MSSMIYFSPTGTTEQVVRYMGQALSLTDAIDLSGDVTERRFEREDLCVVGVPSFGGRVPAIAAQRLEKIRGNQTPALLVVTYGGRAYEDTLIELKDILESHNFVCIGAAAVVAAHSIAPRIAAGRPNKRDFAGLDNFLRDMQQRLCGAPQSVFVPGSRPYKNTAFSPWMFR